MIASSHVTHTQTRAPITPLVLAFALVCPATTPAQPSPAAPLNWRADDSARVAWLAEHGRVERRRHVVVWAPRDSLDEALHRALADTLEMGVAAMRALMQAPLPWQRIADRPVIYYLSPGQYVAHGSGRDAVFIPISRVHSRLAPFLHEAAHELLAPPAPFFAWEHADSAAAIRARDGNPLWLFEGLPDYLAQSVAAGHGIHEGDVFQVGGLARADSACAARLATHSRRDEILAAVGTRARLAALFTTERFSVAPVFYTCSQSLTKYVVEQIGLAETIALFPLISDGRWERRLAERAGRPLETLRREWMTRLGLGS